MRPACAPGWSSVSTNARIYRPCKRAIDPRKKSFGGAVLAQFPALNVGLTRARDTSGLYTVGFGLSLSPPIFNRNRGNIAIEDATR